MGVDVVSDAVQVDPNPSVLLDPTFVFFLSCQAALNAEVAEIRRIQTSMAQVGKFLFRSRKLI